MNFTNMTRELAKYDIILGSSSSRRYDLLKDYLNIHDIKVLKPSFEEDLDKNLYKDDPLKYVHDTCRLKAKSILEEYYPGRYSTKELGAIIICADTIVVGPENQIYEKPITQEKQLEYLTKFCYSYGKKCVGDESVKVITSVALIKDCKDIGDKTTLVIHQFEEITKIYFDPDIPVDIIKTYVDSKDGLHVAGGFKIQGSSAVLIKGIEGDYYNVVGLPVNKTYKTLLHLIN
ncbi:hypothetical protein RI543_001351 [Arxiozyma heterogenica]|uniref:Maf-like protein n=1 Tax=Arxiozyma heterogenica TaxID=278026 RepID=A0AAN7W4F4_9SACH|nr:hypothetical protein RI543_001351 [Kazachstania heterogenica]